MNFVLSDGLQAHRRGRFLATLLGAQPVANEAGTALGLLLMTGEEFQGTPSSRANWWPWGKRPGNALVLLPPYTEGRVVEELDWSISLLQETRAAVTGAPLAETLAAEVSFEFTGIDGSSESSMGHVWTNGSPNTRFWKAHSNSGLFALTTLPLWSISLMNSASVVRDWLTGLYAHVGTTASLAVTTENTLEAGPTPKEFAVMVCCHAYVVGDPDALQDALRQQPVQLMNLNGFDVPGIFVRLRAMGLVEKRGLTDNGLEVLRQSAYWGYAAQLKGAV